MKSKIYNYNDLMLIKKLIDKDEIKVISFDIFDTLLMRPCIYPTDVLHLINCPSSVLKTRLCAESDLKNSFININEIWEYVQFQCHLSNKQMELFLNEELKIERKLLSARPIIKQLFDYAVQRKKKVIAVSDMYFSAEFLKKILHEKGYSSIEQVYVSCEEYARKDNGKLFDKVINSERIEAYNILHIGDNQLSDYKIPLKKGIKAFWLPDNLSLFKRNLIGRMREEQFDQIIPDDMAFRFLLGFAINRSFEERSSHPKSGIITFRQFVNFVIAPYAVYTALFICNNKKIQSGNYSKILFAARDGFLPMHVYERVRGVMNIPSEYLFASRRAYGCLSNYDFIQYFDESIFTSDYKLRDFLKLILPDKSTYQFIEAQCKPAQLNLNINDHRQLCRNLLIKNKAKISSYYNQRRNITEQYYASIFHGSKERVLIFDCGYSGSISASLMEGGVAHKIDKVYLWETSKNRKRDMDNQTITYVVAGGYKTAWLDVVVESFFSSYEGSCIGFSIKGNKIEPIFEPFNKENRMILKETHDEVYLFMDQFMELFGDYQKYFGKNQIQYVAELANILFSGRRNNQKIFDKVIFEDSYLHGERKKTLYDVLRGLDSGNKVVVRLKKGIKRVFINK